MPANNDYAQWLHTNLVYATVERQQLTVDPILVDWKQTALFL